MARSGTLSPGNETDLYRFEATAGDRYYFDSQQVANGDALWRLYGPLGNLVWLQGLPSDVDVLTLGDTGTYTLAIEGRRYTTALNDYRVLAQPLPVVAPVRLSALESTPAPDLRPTDLLVEGTIEAGATVTFHWVDRNEGLLPADVAWRDRVVVTRVGSDEVIASVVLPYDAGALGALAAGAQLARSAAVTLPEGALGAGLLRFAVTLDIDNALAEQNGPGTAEGNNAADTVVTSTLPVYADLQPGALTVTPPSGWEAGAAVTVQWRSTNNGTRDASGPWTETLLVRNVSSNQTVLSQTLTHDGSALAAGGGFVERSVGFSWPSGSLETGLYTFSVTVDSGASVVEVNAGGTGETNNVASLSVASAPDLRVQGLALDPGPLLSSATLTLRWTTLNEGNAVVRNGFSERVRVVNIATGQVILNTAVLYDAAVGGVIAAGEPRAGDQFPAARRAGRSRQLRSDGHERFRRQRQQRRAGVERVQHGGREQCGEPDVHFGPGGLPEPGGRRPGLGAERWRGPDGHRHLDGDECRRHRRDRQLDRSPRALGRRQLRQWRRPPERGRAAHRPPGRRREL
ncbi:CARDB domain-containing protein [Ramlibacter montanisoli]|uniref:CARDB domain-containing protein n=1 Tax=Ramlibacter montanisoli TaxID=2732512 RepID=UPI0028150D4C|nr:CARDB domain-containing protein [Ramlibacter montanisoli]